MAIRQKPKEALTAKELIRFRIYLYRKEDHTIQVNDYTKEQYQLVENKLINRSEAKGSVVCKVYKGYIQPDRPTEGIMWERYGSISDDTSIVELIDQGTQVIFNG